MLWHLRVSRSASIPLVLTTLIALFSYRGATATSITVPKEIGTIQGAVDLSTADTVKVAAGVWQTVSGSVRHAVSAHVKLA